MQKANIWYIMLKFILRCILRIFLKIRINGKKNIDYSDKYIFVCNHKGWLDPIIIFAFMPYSYKVVLFGETNSGYQKKFILFIIKLCKVDIISVNRAQQNSRIQSIRQATRFLNKGNGLIIYPEGRINPHDNILYPFNKGSFFISVMKECPIVPIYMRGNEKLYFRRQININFGNIFSVNKKMKVDEIGERIFNYMKDELVPAKPKNKKNKGLFDITNLFISELVPPPNDLGQPLTNGRDAHEIFSEVNQASKIKYKL